MKTRAQYLDILRTRIHWDIIIIGGGATGLGAAVDAASRGFSTLLVERDDFAKGTSSRSTKLLHGGVRYLAQGNFRLVLDALKERGLLLKNAPHVSSNRAFVIPVYKSWQKWYYAAGLIFYDLLAGRLGLGRTKVLSGAKTVALLPGLSKKNLKGGIVYRDGQFDDSRFAINLAQTAAEQGAILVNYCALDRLVKAGGRISGVELTDRLSLETFSAKATVVINATGVFADAVMAMDEPGKRAVIVPSQGVHIVVDKRFFSGDTALMVPSTSDGRVLFAVPWHDKVVVGTTDTARELVSNEPEPLQSEINFILSNLNACLESTITDRDILSVFAGLRPLVKLSAVNKTALMPRDHSIFVSPAGLVTITGGKWTTYRKMAEEVIGKAVLVGGLHHSPCVTRGLKIHGWTLTDKPGPLSFYGADLLILQDIYEENPAWQALLHPDYPYTKGCVILAVRNEMAMTVEDVLARRTRLLFLDARAAMAAAPTVISLMASELNKNEEWETAQGDAFAKVASKYLPAFTNP